MPDQARADEVCPLNVSNFLTGHHWGHPGDDGWRDCLCGARAFDPNDVRDPELIKRDRKMLTLHQRSLGIGLVAMSPDRRVMVALAPIAEMADGTFLWHTYEWSEEYDSLVETDTYYLDDGDSADDILRRHLFELQMRKAR